jgi:hypothetical protein
LGIFLGIFKINKYVSGVLFEYYYEYVHKEDIKILRIVTEHSSIALELLRQDYPHGELKLLEIRPLDT